MEENEKKTLYRNLIIFGLCLSVITGLALSHTRNIERKRELLREYAEKQAQIEQDKEDIVILSYTASSSDNEHRIKLKNYSDRTVRYIEINIFKKLDGVVVDSSWTNWSGSFLPGAYQTITKLDFDIDNNYSYSYEITEVIFE